MKRERESFNLELDRRQKMDLTNLLNIELRQEYIKKEYADRLNSLFLQLMGRNHDIWEKNFKEE